MAKHLQNKEEQYLLIQRFLDFDLSAEELQEFEKRLKEDESFQQRFHLYRVMENHIEETIINKVDLAPTTQQLNLTVPINNKKEERSSRIIGMRRMLSIAAGIALVIASMVGIQNYLQPSDPASLAMEYWTTTDKVTFNKLRSNTDVVDNKLLIASELFDKGDYQSVLTTLNGMLPTDPSYLNALLLQGEAYMALNKPKQAVELFQIIIEHPSGTQRSSTLWYQALGYLSIGQKEEATANLQEIIRQQYPIAPKAKELLEKIN